MVAHVIGGSSRWQIKSEPQRAANEAIGESLAKSKAQAAIDEQRKAILTLLDLPQNGYTVTRANGDDYRVAAIFAKLLAPISRSTWRIMGAGRYLL